jgi:hypothetical protein
MLERGQTKRERATERKAFEQAVKEAREAFPNVKGMACAAAALALGSVLSGF